MELKTGISDYAMNNNILMKKNKQDPDRRKHKT